MHCCSEDMNSAVTIFIGFVLFLVITLISRAAWLLFSRKNEACEKRDGPIKTLVVVGSGGHTMEILALLRGLSVKFTPKVYVIADTDKRSQHKVLEFEKSKIAEFDGKSEFNIRRIPRSREVGQSYLTSVISTVVSSFFSFSMVIQEMPDLLLMVKDIKVVYIESICRVKSLSLSAKILYYVVDRLIVQWPELCEKYSRTVYLGRTI
ncbi:UDP-N-acetylglucosamine transferase subunit ALG14 homolog isoform X2 [Rhopilema esculentum]|uniref:UDP-N-acetylglucosamine transferase subunit ALG14 homolog isoform X2 n=1 Tax=Rhopilema esculentum TaxID=499914 RepID=UPI0031DEECA4